MNQPQKEMNITVGETLVEFESLKSHLARKKKYNQHSYFSLRNLHTGPLAWAVTLHGAPSRFSAPTPPPLPSNYCTVPNSIASLPLNTFI